MPSALLDRLCREIPALVQSRPPTARRVEVVRGSVESSAFVDGKLAVERALLEEPHARALALADVAASMPPDHPDRGVLARAQLELMKLAPSSQPHRVWRLQLLDARVPADLHAEVRAVLEDWPEDDRALALLAWSRHTPELRAEAFDALERLGPELRALGTVLHFDLLPEHAPPRLQAARRRGRDLALAWETQGETPAVHHANELFFERATVDAADLWTLLAEHAADRASALDAVEHAERCRTLGHRAALVRIAICAAEEVKDDEIRRRALARIADATWGVLDLPQRMEHLGHLGRQLSEEHQRRWIALLRECVDAQSPRDYLDRARAEIVDLPHAEARALCSHVVQSVLARREPAPLALLDLAELTGPESRDELLSRAFAELEASPSLSYYPLFRCLRPDDPWPLHERLAALVERTTPEMDRAHLTSCLAASQPEGRRGEMLERALAAWDRQGLNKFDIGEIPTENLWPIIDLRGARRILELCASRREDEGTEECLAGLLGHLAKLGEEPLVLVTHLGFLRTPYLRIGALIAIAPRLTPGEIATQLRSAVAATMADEGRCTEVLEILPLVRCVDPASTAEVLDLLESHLRSNPEVIRAAHWDSTLDVLLGLGERSRAERWLSLTGPCSAAVEGCLSLASRLPVGDPRRAELARSAEEMSEHLSAEDQRQLYCELAGHEALLTEDWACRLVHRALSEDRMCIRDLMPWMSVARTALGDERLASLVASLVAI